MTPTRRVEFMTLCSRGLLSQSRAGMSKEQPRRFTMLAKDLEQPKRTSSTLFARSAMPNAKSFVRNTYPCTARWDIRKNHRRDETSELKDETWPSVDFSQDMMDRIKSELNGKFQDMIVGLMTPPDEYLADWLRWALQVCIAWLLLEFLETASLL